jgi:hypothetical protein
MAISMFCEGAHFVLLPAHCAKIFGSSKRGVQAYSYMFSCFGLSSVMGSILIGYLQDAKSVQDPYMIIFCLAAILTMFALIILGYYNRILNREMGCDDDYKCINTAFVAKNDTDSDEGETLMDQLIRQKIQLKERKINGDCSSHNSSMPFTADSDYE